MSIDAINLFQFAIDKPWNYVYDIVIKRQFRPHCPLCRWPLFERELKREMPPAKSAFYGRPWLQDMTIVRGYWNDKCQLRGYIASETKFYNHHKANRPLINLRHCTKNVIFSNTPRGRLGKNPRSTSRSRSTGWAPLIWDNCHLGKSPPEEVPPKAYWVIYLYCHQSHMDFTRFSIKPYNNRFFIVWPLERNLT